MLHASTSEAKTETMQSNAQIMPQPERELHPRLLSAAGPYSLSGRGSVTSSVSPEVQRRQALAGMQSTHGNQAVLRMLHSPQQIARVTALRPSQGVMVQRKCACGGSSETQGECEECKAKHEGTLQRQVATPTVSPTAGVIQTKLAINKPGDQYEQEADRIADQVLAASSNLAASDAPPRIPRFIGQAPGPAETEPASVDHVLASPGRPLDPALQQDMEQRFGHDFSQVRVHSSAAAEQSARDVRAHAYTVGQDIVFGAGQYTPNTMSGRRLLAHELTHTIQQQETARVQRAPAATDSRDEKLDAAIGSVQQALARVSSAKTNEEERRSSQVLHSALANLHIIKGARTEVQVQQAKLSIIADIRHYFEATKLPMGLQRKAIGWDKENQFEHEAEAVATRVMQGSIVGNITQAPTSLVQRQPAEMAEEFIEGEAAPFIEEEVAPFIEGAWDWLMDPINVTLLQGLVEEIPSKDNTLDAVFALAVVLTVLKRQLQPQPEPEQRSRTTIDILPRVPEEKNKKNKRYPLCWPDAHILPPPQFPRGVLWQTFIRIKSADRDEEEAAQHRMQLRWRQFRDPDFNPDKYHVHHVVPLFLGGPDDLYENGVTWIKTIHLKGHAQLRQQPQMADPSRVEPLPPLPKDMYAHPGLTLYELVGTKGEGECPS